MTDMTTTIADVVKFWTDAGPDSWFAKSDEFDLRFRTTFAQAHMDAAARKLDHWLDSAEGALALMILLDQYPRNSFRGTGHMFATDSLARFYAAETIARGHMDTLPEELRPFLAIPYMHSESLADQERSLELYRAIGEPNLHHAIVHHEIIEKFGRFPHRNEVLGRATTATEAEFLSGGGFAG